jgi:hypothetical protein
MQTSTSRRFFLARATTLTAFGFLSARLRAAEGGGASLPTAKPNSVAEVAKCVQFCKEALA